jgi:putative acetyltransferase
MHPPSISTDIQTRPETEAEVGAVEAMHRRAFGESGEKIVTLVRMLRQAPAALAPISLVAVRGDVPIGHILLSAGRLDAAPRLVDVFTLSPLAVDPTQQRRGVGTALIAAALQEADRQAVPLVFLEGSSAYYGARGFKRASALGFRSPSLRIPDAAFQVARLSRFEQWMTGSFVYSEAFWALDCVGLRAAS